MSENELEMCLYFMEVNMDGLDLITSTLGEISNGIDSFLQSRDMNETLGLQSQEAFNNMSILANRLDPKINHDLYLGGFGYGYF